MKDYKFVVGEWYIIKLAPFSSGKPHDYMFKFLKLDKDGTIHSSKEVQLSHGYTPNTRNIKLASIESVREIRIATHEEVLVNFRNEKFELENTYQIY